MRIVVVAEYYPRRADPLLGVWAHRQAVAARECGAEVRVLVLHRLVPPRRALHERDLRGLVAPLRQPARHTLDGLSVSYVPFVSPPFGPSAVARWGAWAAPSLALALRALRRRFAFDLVHAHYAVPTADAVLRTRTAAPLVVSVHGGDVLRRRGVEVRRPAGSGIERQRHVSRGGEGGAGGVVGIAGVRK